MKPGGRLLVYVPAVPLAYGTLDRMLGHYRRYTAQSLGRVLRGAGLDPGPVDYFNLFGLLGWFVNGRILRRTTLSENQIALFERLVTLPAHRGPSPPPDRARRDLAVPPSRE